MRKNNYFLGLVCLAPLAVSLINISEMEATASNQFMPTSTTQIVAQGEQDIVDTAIASGSFNTLVTALQAAELVDTLKGEGPFTVFAPTDEAFAALPEGTLEKLLQPENKETLVKILTYHVVAGSVMSGDLSSGAVATVEGSEVMVEVGDMVTVGGATVTTPDISATNGVIHVIDQVILPPDVEL